MSCLCVTPEDVELTGLNVDIAIKTHSQPHNDMYKSKLLMTGSQPWYGNPDFLHASVKVFERETGFKCDERALFVGHHPSLKTTFL